MSVIITISFLRSVIPSGVEGFTVKTHASTPLSMTEWVFEQI